MSTPTGSPVRGPRKRRVAAGILLGLVAVVGVVACFFEWNWLKSPIENAITQSTGRRFEIQGDLHGEWSLHPHIRMEQVRFANPPWAKNPLMFSADAVEIQLELLPLLKHHVHIYDLGLDRPAVFLERLADQRANWLLDNKQDDQSAAPVVDALRVARGTVELDDALTHSRFKANVQDTPPDTKGKDPLTLKFSAKGTYRGEALDVRGATLPIMDLQKKAESHLPLNVHGTVAGTAISLEGGIDGLSTLATLNLRYRIQGPSLARLSPVFGVPLLETPPYTVSGVLTRAGNRWETHDLQGKVGTSDIAGKVAVVIGGKKPVLDTTLVSTRLDLADLRPLIGDSSNSLAPQAGDPTRLFPQKPFDLSRINELDAHVNLSSKRILRTGGLPIDDFTVDLLLRDGQITLDPIEFGMAGGKLRAKVALNAHQQPMKVDGTARMTGVKVEKIFPDQAQLGKAAGTLAGLIDLKTTGNSVAAMLATADGRTALMLSDGRIPSVLPALADLDGMRVISTFLGKKPESVRCAAIDLNIKKGIANPNVAIFETDTTVLNTSGTLNLRDEGLDLKVSQEPKKPSFLSLRTPIIVKGTLKNPAIRPELAPLALRGGAALALAAINPLAALAALIETGPGVEGACPAIQRALKRGGVGEPRAAASVPKDGTLVAPSATGAGASAPGLTPAPAGSAAAGK